jgi:hypothetical protein
MAANSPMSWRNGQVLLDSCIRGEFAFLEWVLDVQADVQRHTLARRDNERHGVATSGPDRHSPTDHRVAARKKWPPEGV